MNFDRRLDNKVWKWAIVDLPHLTRLSFEGKPANVLGDIVCAKMPALHTATLPFHHKTKAATFSALATAFPKLRELTLKGHRNAPPPKATVKALGRDVVPLLETLKWSVKGKRADDLARHLLPEGPIINGPRWPQLRCLDLRFPTHPQKEIDTRETEFCTALARSAPHSPALRSLSIQFGKITFRAAVFAFAAAAKDVGAWPLLSELRFNYYRGYRDPIVKSLRETWPAVAIP
jgi:hypothetical protein